MLEHCEEDLQCLSLLHCLILLLHFLLSFHDGSNGLALPCPSVGQAHCCPCRQVSIVCVMSYHSRENLFEHFPTKKEACF